MSKREVPDRPHRRSWLDVVYDWIERVPGPPWFFHLVFAALLVGLGMAADATRSVPPPVPTALGAFQPAFNLAIVHWLRTLTARAAARMQPALEGTAEERARFRFRLTVAPPLLSAIMVLWTAVRVVSDLQEGGALDTFDLASLSAPFMWALTFTWILGESVLAVFFVVTIRRLILILRIQRELRDVSLLRQHALQAFSAVSFSTALALLAQVLPIPLLSPVDRSDPTWVYTIGISVVLAAAVAVLPLLRVHNRLVAEQRRILEGVNERLERVLLALEGAVDALDTGAIDANQRALAALLAEKDLIKKAPTWPWTTGAIRTLATTVLMPITLLVGGRLFDAWLRGQ